MKKKQRRETSKVLTWLIINLYLALLLFSIPALKLWNLNIAFALDYLQPIVLMIIGSYFVKAGAENVIDIWKKNEAKPAQETEKVQGSEQVQGSEPEENIGRG